MVVVRKRVWEPPPQVAVQVDQADHSDCTQSTGQESPLQLRLPHSLRAAVPARPPPLPLSLPLSALPDADPSLSLSLGACHARPRCRETGFPAVGIGLSENEPWALTLVVLLVLHLGGTGHTDLLAAPWASAPLDHRPSRSPLAEPF